jgi:hypothetical protein
VLECEWGSYYLVEIELILEQGLEGKVLGFLYGGESAIEILQVSRLNECLCNQG